jgi:hypothetical protein
MSTQQESLAEEVARKFNVTLAPADDSVDYSGSLFESFVWGFGFTMGAVTGLAFGGLLAGLKTQAGTHFG